MEGALKMKQYDVYLYGMTVLSTMHLLRDDYPEPDTYGEIKETYNLPGGETGNSALILSGFGCSVKVAGNYLGKNTKDKIIDFFNQRNIDTSGLYYDDTFDGVEDIVLIDKKTRTVFGKFGAYFSDPKNFRRWNVPEKEDIQNAKVVGLDPFFFEESTKVAHICKELGKKYVVIDCKPDIEMHQYANATVISNEFIRNNFPDKSIEELYRDYTATSNSLVIFTFGSREIYYGRKNQKIHRIKPYKVEVKSTLGAGDAFKAGVIYGILKEMNDEETVRFAAATAGYVCAHFPFALKPPAVDQIYGLINSAQ